MINVIQNDTINEDQTAVTYDKKITLFGFTIYHSVFNTNDENAINDFINKEHKIGY